MTKKIDKKSSPPKKTAKSVPGEGKKKPSNAVGTVKAAAEKTVPVEDEKKPAKTKGAGKGAAVNTTPGEGEKKQTKNAGAGKGTGEKKRSAMKIGEVKGGAIYVMQAGSPVYLKTADVCALTGTSNQWIGQLTSEGVMNKQQTAHGALYELHDTIGAYIEMLKARVEKKTATMAEIDLDRLRSEARLKKYKADMAEFDAQERAGKMHRSEDVQAMTEDLIFTLRSSLLAFPGRVAPALVGIESAAEAASIVDGEIRKIMAEMAMYKYDPEKYDERVRARLKLETRELLDDDDDDE